MLTTGITVVNKDQNADKQFWQFMHNQSLEDLAFPVSGLDYKNEAWGFFSYIEKYRVWLSLYFTS